MRWDPAELYELARAAAAQGWRVDACDECLLVNDRNSPATVCELYAHATPKHRIAHWPTANSQPTIAEVRAVVGDAPKAGRGKP